jgi:hypothetical protein
MTLETAYCSSLGDIIIRAAEKSMKEFGRIASVDTLANVWKKLLSLVEPVTSSSSLSAGGHHARRAVLASIFRMLDSR